MIITGLFANSTPILLSGAYVSNASQFFNTITVFGIKGFSSNGFPVNNTGLIFVGPNSGILPMSVTAGGSFNFSLPNIKQEYYQNFYVGGGSGDGYCVLGY